jgi:hypothetical protein
MRFFADHVVVSASEPRTETAAWSAKNRMVGGRISAALDRQAMVGSG